MPRARQDWCQCEYDQCRQCDSEPPFKPSYEPDDEWQYEIYDGDAMQNRQLRFCVLLGIYPNAERFDVRLQGLHR